MISDYYGEYYNAARFTAKNGNININGDIKWQKYGYYGDVTARLPNHQICKGRVTRCDRDVAKGYLRVDQNNLMTVSIYDKAASYDKNKSLIEFLPDRKFLNKNPSHILSQNFKGVITGPIQHLDGTVTYAESEPPKPVVKPAYAGTQADFFKRSIDNMYKQ